MAYLSVMAQGLQLLASLKPTTVMRTNTTYPLSGKDLMFGEENVDTKSLHYTRPFSPAETMKEYPLISQGEFWRGTIPTKELKKMCQQRPKRVCCVVDEDLKWGGCGFPRQEKEKSVLIKVSSKPVFNSLVDPEQSFKAIKAREEEEQLSALEKVLIAVWKAPQGLVTIMRDQEALGLVDLRPIETKTSTSDLCENFMELARKQLLPLARADIIHPDIRVGYDYTANIMAKSDGSNMVLVDFESLVLFSDYTVPKDKHRRYLPKMKNAFAFLFLQCYVVAVFWSKKKRINW